MANYKQGHVGVVIRKDGTVPFDDDCSEEVRAAIIAHLVEQGHTLKVIDVPGAKHKHVKIKGWKSPVP